MGGHACVSEGRIKVFNSFDYRRIVRYLGGVMGASPTEYSIDARNISILCGASEFSHSIFKRYSHKYDEIRFGIMFDKYIGQAQDLVRKVNKDGHFLIRSGDNRSGFKVPTLVKSRDISEINTLTTIIPLNYKRHWGEVRNYGALDIPFEAKDDKLVWRGVTTGLFQKKNKKDTLSSRYFVPFITKTNANIDISFSGIVQINESDDEIMEMVKSSIGTRLSVEQQLRSKFLLSLEGNDVSTGLKWMLNSASTVVMPQPKCESWACEGLLNPFEHYVPVKHDLSDIEDVYEWCMHNQQLCKEIGLNGKRFISEFLDPVKEETIIKEVLSQYLSKAQFCSDIATRDLNESYTSPDQLIASAMVAVANKNFRYAETLLIEGLNKFQSFKDKNGHPYFTKELVRMYLHQGHMTKAEALAPKGYQSWYHVLTARAYTAKGRITEANAHWHAILERNPLHGEAHKALERLAKGM